MLFVFKTHSCFVACTDLKLKSSLPPQTPTVKITDVCYHPRLVSIYRFTLWKSSSVLVVVQVLPFTWTGRNELCVLVRLTSL